jgi:TfoX/Sxy family transcriptional regulator of competence genes
LSSSLRSARRSCSDAVTFPVSLVIKRLIVFIPNSFSSFPFRGSPLHDTPFLALKSSGVSSVRGKQEGMKGPTKKPDPLVARLRAVLRDEQITEQRMFGGVCFMLRGNMVAGTLRGELLVRVGKEANAAALQRPHARQMEMSPPAPGYIIVSNAGTDRDEDLNAWVALAVAHVRTLPPKARKEATS